LLVVEVPELASAANPIVQTRAISSAAEANFLIFLNFLFDFLFSLQVLTNLTSIQGALAIILPDEVKAKLIECFHC
jgi:hypothetical protein